MRRFIIGILILTLVILPLIGCGADSITEPADTKDEVAAIEQVIRDYFEAFNEYDVDRVGSLIAEETRETEGVEILMAVVFAQGLNLKFEVAGITVLVDGDHATAVVTAKTSLGSGDDTFNLVRENGDWKVHSMGEKTEEELEVKPEPTVEEPTVEEPEPAVEEPEPIEPDVDEPEPVQEPEPVLEPAAGYARSNPAAIGTELYIEQDRLGDVYKYNITLLEIVRGEEAWLHIEEDRMFAKPPPSGFEYLVAKIRFEYLEGPTPEESILVYGDMFTAVSSEGKAYRNPTMAFDPEPSLHSDLYSGATHEGWAVYTVSVQDDKPLLTFGELLFGGCIWWQLY